MGLTIGAPLPASHAAWARLIVLGVGPSTPLSCPDQQQASCFVCMTASSFFLCSFLWRERVSTWRARVPPDSRDPLDESMSGGSYGHTVVC